MSSFSHLEMRKAIRSYWQIGFSLLGYWLNDHSVSNRIGWNFILKLAFIFHLSIQCSCSLCARRLNWICRPVWNICESESFWCIVSAPIAGKNQTEISLPFEFRAHDTNNWEYFTYFNVSRRRKIFLDVHFTVDSSQDFIDPIKELKLSGSTRFQSEIISIPKVIRALGEIFVISSFKF